MRSRVLIGLITGTLGGFLGWLSQEMLIPHSVTRDVLTGKVLPVAMTAGQSALFNFCVSGFLGLFLGSVDGVTEGSSRKLGRGMVIGAIAGVVLGWVGLTAGNYAYNLLGGESGKGLGLFSFAQQVLARTVGWGFLGLGIGVGISLATESGKRIRNGAIGGLIGGLIGGFVFDMVAMASSVTQGAVGAGQGFEAGGPSRAIGITCIGAFAGLFIALVDELMKQAWVKVLAGKNEGKDFILSKQMNILGRDERADVPLFGDNTVGGQHSAIRAEKSRHYLIDAGTQLGTVVNGQRVAGELLLRDGDMIQIGTHRILFREKATQSKFARDPVDIKKANSPISNVQMPAHLCPYCGSTKGADGSCKCSIAPTGEMPIGASPYSMPPMGISGSPTAPLANIPVPGYGSPMPTMQAGGGVVSRLTIVEGQYAGKVFALSGQPVMIGRDMGCEIGLLMDNRASRNHARIAFENGAYVLYDNNSSNGTFVNNIRIAMHVLAPGDVIIVGETKFRCEA